MTFEERPDKGDNWNKQKDKREQLAHRNLEKGNKPISVFEADNERKNKKNPKK